MNLWRKILESSKISQLLHFNFAMLIEDSRNERLLREKMQEMKRGAGVTVSATDVV